MRLIVCIVVMIHQCYSDEQKWSFYVLNFTISIFIQLEKFKSSSRLCECKAVHQIDILVYSERKYELN